MERCLVGDTAMNRDGAVALLERVTSGSTVRREVWPVRRGHQPELTLLPRPAHGEVEGHPTLSTSEACALTSWVTAPIQHVVAFSLRHPSGSAAETDFLSAARALGTIPGWRDSSSCGSSAPRAISPFRSRCTSRVKMRSGRTTIIRSTSPLLEIVGRQRSAASKNSISSRWPHQPRQSAPRSASRPAPGFPRCSTAPRSAGPTPRALRRMGDPQDGTATTKRRIGTGFDP
jgi:hypothetical protein